MRTRDAEELWRRFGAGDGSAFIELYRDHQLDVVRYCRSLLRDDEDAQDAAQGTWAAIWTTPDAARRDIPLRPWLFRVAHNQAISIIRRRRPHEALAELELPAVGDVAEDVELRERLATLRTDLVNLPERQRVALLSRELGGLGHAEIGEALGISAAAAKQTIYEARRALVEAETGRSMACELVQREISDGDGRARRGRRLSAHLRGCADCRTFAAAVGRRRRDLRLLFPAPALLGLLTRAAAGTGGAGGAGAGLALAGGGGAVATKVAVAAAVLAVAGVGGHHELDKAGGAEAKAAPLSRSAAGAPARAAASPRRRSVAVAPARQPSPRATTKAIHRSASPHAHAKAPAPHRPSAPVAAVRAPVAAQPVPVKKAEDVQPPGQVKKAEGARPPGQVKKAEGAQPPGQAKKAEGAQPPGQAKKTDVAAAPVPATATDGSASAPATPPGQAKKTEHDARHAEAL